MTQPGVEADRSPQESTAIARLANALRRLYDRARTLKFKSAGFEDR
jgi:hypothetical protein